MTAAASAAASAGTEDLLRQLAPQVLGAMVRRSGNFADAEDAVQEAMLAATRSWAADGLPENPTGWLIAVAQRRMAEQFRRDEARRRREATASSSLPRSTGDDDGGVASSRDDSLILMFMCGHPALSTASAVALTLRAVGGLTTREIASSFLVPEATMAQRISRAKALIERSGEPFALPSGQARMHRLQSVLRVLYLIFNEGYATSAGPDLARSDLSGEAIRLARMAAAALPDDPEVAGLLSLMLLTEARRPARTGQLGELVPLAEQDRSLWDRALIVEGVELMTEALGRERGPMGEYQCQAAIAALHDQALRALDTDWHRIVLLYDRLETVAPGPMVTLNRAVAVSMVDGPERGLELLEGVRVSLGEHHRFHAVRGHLLALGGDGPAASAAFRQAASRARNVREQQYLVLQASRSSDGTQEA